MAASYNAGFQGDTVDTVANSLRLDKCLPMPTNGHHQLQLGNSSSGNGHHQTHSGLRYNNNNSFYGNGTPAGSLATGLSSISPESNDDHHLYNELLLSFQNTSLSGSPSPPVIERTRRCGCDEYQYRCIDCKKLLCESCMLVHYKNHVTKDHTITVIAPGSLPSPGDSPDSLSSLPHSPPPPPKSVLCRSPLAATSHPNTIMIKKTEDALDMVGTTIASVEQRGLLTSSEIRNIFSTLNAALVDREQKLLMRAERVTSAKHSVLNQQAESLRQHLCAINNSPPPSSSTSPPSVVPLPPRAPPLLPCEDDIIGFSPTDAQKLFNLISSFGKVTSSGCADLTVATGDGIKRAIRGRVATFTVRVADHLGEPKTTGRDLISAIVTDQSARSTQANVQDQGDGSYIVTWIPRIEGIHELSVTLRGRPIRHSPFHPMVRPGRDYRGAGVPCMIIGEEGEGKGQLCRPWGVACDKEGRFVVADRSNNRIQVYESDGTYRHMFGSLGCSPGQFDRPAGVAVDALGRIVVADKDNHRIQVFTFEGVFLLKFGDKGSKIGQFNYPWDVSTDPDSRIVVSDTRNHRVQLFDHNGNYICKFGFENNSSMWKHFDSPRGVCWAPDGSVIVTDFNNHRLVVIAPDFSTARSLGGEGSSYNQFLRPQGVTVDEEGYIIVADSRNSRVQIFEPNGSFVHKFGLPGHQSGEMDRPSGICVAPNGKIVVCDFGNNRIQVF